MNAPLRIDSFAAYNIAERGVLADVVEPGDQSVKLVSTEGFVAGQAIYIGSLGREGIEKASVASVPSQTELTLVSPVELAHARSSDVTAVLGDRIKVYRAPNADGNVPPAAAFNFLASRSIDPDQPSTYHRDSEGSSAFWYAWSYFSVESGDETKRSTPVRGDDFAHYASISEIRSEAGMQNAHNLADSDVDRYRRDAETEINAALRDKYTVPFKPVPDVIHSMTIKLAAALLLVWSYGNVAPHSTQLTEVRKALQTYAIGDQDVPNQDGGSLSSAEGVSYDFGDAPRAFRIGDRF